MAPQTAITVRMDRPTLLAHFQTNPRQTLHTYLALIYLVHINLHPLQARLIVIIPQLQYPGNR